MPETVTLVRIDDNGHARVMPIAEFLAEYGDSAEDILSGIVAGKKAIRFYLSACMAKNFGKRK